MLKKTPRFLLPAGLALALAFTFSCSDDGDDPPVTLPSSSSNAGVNQLPIPPAAPSSSSEEAIPEPVFGLLSDDRDEHEYKTVVIGTQTWMAENLNYYVPFCGMPVNGIGENCAGFTEHTESSVCVLPNHQYAVQENNEYCDKYGRAYTWAAAMEACPDGWHLPSDDDWKILINYVNGDKTGIYIAANNIGAGPKLKAKEGWDNNPKYPNGTDNYGFSALPGGYVGVNGRTQSLGVTIRFWSSDVHRNSSSPPSDLDIIASAHTVEIMGDDLRFYPNSTGTGVGNGMHEPNYVRCVED